MSTESTALLPSSTAPSHNREKSSDSNFPIKSTEAAFSSHSSSLNYHSIADPIGSFGTKGTEASAMQVVDERRRKEKRVLIGALLFCFAFMVVEFGAGMVAHSLALLTDATHMLTDVGSYSLSLFALMVAGKSACGTFNYGWHRAEVLGTLFSLFTIYVLVGWIVIEAFSRIYGIYRCSSVPGRIFQLENLPKGTGPGAAHSAEVLKELDALRHQRCDAIDSRVMIIVGVLGLLVNVVCACILFYGGSHGHSHFGGHGGHSHAHGGHSHADDHEGHSHSRGESHGHSHGGEEHHHPHSEDGEHTATIMEDNLSSHTNEEGSMRPSSYHHSGSRGCRRASRRLSHLRLEADSFVYVTDGDGHHDHGSHGGHDEGKEGGGWGWSAIYNNPASSPLGEGTGMAINAALLHAMGDCVQSLGVIFAGFFIFVSNRWVYHSHASPNSLFNLADPVCSIFFAVITLRMTTGLLGDLLGILMETTPGRINYDVVEQTLLEINNVDSIHDLHVWSLNSDYVALSAHLVTDDAENVLRKAQLICRDRFNVDHTTFQVDTIKSGNSLCPGNCSP